MSTTSLPIFRREIQFALCPFRSLLLRVSQLFSFPAGTKMFQFPEYICLSAYAMSRRCSHSEISGSKPACGSPELIAACHVLRHHPSQAIHRRAYKIIPDIQLNCNVKGDPLPTRIIEYDPKTAVSGFSA